MERFLRIFYPLAVVLFFSGCSVLGTYNTATGQREFIAISTPQEIAMGQGMHDNLLKEYHLSNQKDKLERVRRIGQRLAQISDRQDYAYNFYIVEKKEQNAFTTPGGNIYIFTGLLGQLTTDDQIAAVLAHEIGHCAARHTVKKIQAAMGYSLVESIVFSSLGLQDQAKQIASLSSDVVSNLVFSAYSRQDELQADRLGVKYMYLAGYNLNGMIETLEILKKESKGNHVPEILMTHPHLDARIIAAKEEIQKVRSQFK